MCDLRWLVGNRFVVTFLTHFSPENILFRRRIIRFRVAMCANKNKPKEKSVTTVPYDDATFVSRQNVTRCQLSKIYSYSFPSRPQTFVSQFRIRFKTLFYYLFYACVRRKVEKCARLFVYLNWWYFVYFLFTKQRPYKIIINYKRCSCNSVVGRNVLS